MNELSLFTGIGGGLLGTKLLGWRSVGYVEWDKYCCRVLEQRIKDGILDDAPIFCLDIREFNRRIAEKYRGVVDVISSGFPCQPFSVAGKRRGDQDERNMWPATIECIRLVRPRHLLLENVPGLLTHKYVRRIYGDLAESGYNPKWRCLSAAEVGANHKRNRWWVVATDSTVEQARWQEAESRLDLEQNSLDNRRRQESSDRPSKVCQDVADSKSPECKCTGDSRTRRVGLADEGSNSRIGLSDSTVPRLERQEPTRESWEHERLSAKCGWWQPEPDVGRLVDGCPSRVDRLKSLGNAQVPLCVATAYALLSQDDY